MDARKEHPYIGQPIIFSLLHKERHCCCLFMHAKWVSFGTALGITVLQPLLLWRGRTKHPRW